MGEAIPSQDRAEGYFKELNNCTGAPANPLAIF